MNKSLTVILVIILSLLVVGLSGLLYFTISNPSMNIFKFSASFGYSTKLIDEKEIDEIKDLNINTNISDVKIEEKDIDYIKVEMYSDNEKSHSIIDGSKEVEISLIEKNKVFGLFNKTGNIKVYVPKDYNKVIKVNSNVGDIKILNLNNASLVTTSTVGDVKVQNINEANIIIKTGDIKINNVNTLVAKGETGDIKVEKVETINATLTTGDIKIGSVTNSLDLSSKTGDIKVENANIKRNSKIDSGVGDVKIKSIRGCYILGKTNVGDTKINNFDRKSDIELNINSRVGDIKVNY